MKNVSNLSWIHVCRSTIRKWQCRSRTYWNETTWNADSFIHVWPAVLVVFHAGMWPRKPAYPKNRNPPSALNRFGHNSCTSFKLPLAANSYSQPSYLVLILGWIGARSSSTGRFTYIQEQPDSSVWICTETKFYSNIYSIANFWTVWVTVGLFECLIVSIVQRVSLSLDCYCGINRDAISFNCTCLE